MHFLLKFKHFLHLLLFLFRSWLPFCGSLFFCFGKHIQANNLKMAYLFRCPGFCKQCSPGPHSLSHLSPLLCFPSDLCSSECGCDLLSGVSCESVISVPDFNIVVTMLIKWDRPVCRPVFSYYVAFCLYHCGIHPLNKVCQVLFHTFSIVKKQYCPHRVPNLIYYIR